LVWHELTDKTIGFENFFWFFSLGNEVVWSVSSNFMCQSFCFVFWGGIDKMCNLHFWIVHPLQRNFKNAIFEGQKIRLFFSLFFQNKWWKIWTIKKPTFVQYGEYLGGTTKKNYHLFFFTAFLKCTFFIFYNWLIVPFHDLFIKKS